MRIGWMTLGRVGCHNLEGTWQGACTGEGDELGLELVVETDVEQEVEGTAVITITVGGDSLDSELDLEGTRQGKAFELELDSAGWAMALSGTHQQRTLEGDCFLEITVQGLTIAEEGSFLLERSD